MPIARANQIRMHSNGIPLDWLKSSFWVVVCTSFLAGCHSTPPPTSLLRVSDAGFVLEASSGLPVYTYVLDKPGFSRCYGECLRYFRPVKAIEGELRPGLTLFRRTDGELQLALSGRPLYISTSDTIADLRSHNEPRRDGCS